MKLLGLIWVAAAIVAGNSFVLPSGSARQSHHHDLHLTGLFAGPKSRSASTGARRRRSPPRSKISKIARNRRDDDTRKNESPGVFDGKALTAAQEPNELSAQPLDLQACLQDGTLRCMSDDAADLQYKDRQQLSSSSSSSERPPFQFYSLEKLFGKKFADCFHSSTTFRRDLRAAIRKDVFDTTPLYANMSSKAATVLLLPDSSLQGSWRKPVDTPTDELRMKETTRVLKTHLLTTTTKEEDSDDDDDLVMDGDELMHQIGALCGAKPSTHWIDIVGVQDRVISHSFHQDTGLAPTPDSRTVLWGFPPEDDYTGTGVFSHVVTLQRECLAPVNHPHRQPVLFDGNMPKECIVRPEFAPGKELLAYRDIDVLHSSPDVAYRMSLMRFM